ncbi:MAG: D-alanyl-D-alanine carboxypeptidase/D-alanyl-D-alanine-endopeptidase [Henriciella sp.]|nr:D-alanyl-D-alanine carboxypeptidase/D-alanyl-D-alanine-endopeptidase [Henriciella sp.]
MSACTSLSRSIETQLYANPDQTGIRWGLVVADMDGTELIALKPEDRFTPASNTKIATTMAAFANLEALQSSQLAPGLSAYLQDDAEGGPPDLVLVGGGDAMIADGPDCETYCLAEIADQIVSAGLPAVGDVIGDDTLFPNERWGPGWSQEDLQFYYGTAVSALSVNENELWLTVTPGLELGALAQIDWREGDEFYTLVNETVTVAADQPRRIVRERLPGSRLVRVYGEMPIGAAPVTYELGMDDPALFAAIRLQRLLEARGVSVTGAVRAIHRPLTLQDFPVEPVEDAELPAAGLLRPLVPRETPIARLEPTPLVDSLERVSRDSQNLHAELALRRLGLIDGTGSRAHGLEKVHELWEAAGVTEIGYAVHGGSGMSIYNRITPRGMVKLLHYASDQPWFAVWKAQQPVAGQSGSLERRFKGTALEGKLFAKTGTLNGANALSGYMIAASGRELIFSIVANDRPGLTASAIPEMDAALVAIAAAY